MISVFVLNGSCVAVKCNYSQKVAQSEHKNNPSCQKERFVHLRFISVLTKAWSFKAQLRLVSFSHICSCKRIKTVEWKMASGQFICLTLTVSQKLNGAKTRTSRILRFGKLLGPDRDTAGTRVRSVCMCVSWAPPGHFRKQPLLRRWWM